MKTISSETHNLGLGKGRSCLTDLLEFLDAATDSFDKGKQLDVSYLDFSMTFGNVPHRRIRTAAKSSQC